MATYGDQVLLSSMYVQNRLRLYVGLPSAIIILLIAIASGASFRYALILAGIVVGYLGYLSAGFALLKFSTPANVQMLRIMVLVTALLDPLLLSLALAAGGAVVAFFSAFHVFTTLGYGARFTKREMLASQAAALLSFALVIQMPSWAGAYDLGRTMLLMTLLVPTYAAMLISRLRTEADIAWEKETKARKQALEALAESMKSQHTAEEESRAKSRLLAKVSHEMRTPLTSIVGYSRLIEARAKNPEVLGLVSIISQMAGGLNSEINQLLDFAKYRDVGFSLDLCEVSLPSLVQTIEARFSVSAQNKGLSLNLWVDPSLGMPVMVDKHGLDTVLSNLLGNALKFTPQGHVAVNLSRVKADGHFVNVAFSVTDTGIGIAPEHQARIFDEFYQVSEGRSRKYDGYGLGMTLASKIVSAMGSTITVRSKVGEGTTFSFILTLQKGGDIKAPAEVQDDAAQFEILRNRSVLVVEDNRTISEMAKLILQIDGHRVQIASDGAEGLAALRTGNFDVVFLDYNMPDMDGVEMLNTYFAATPPAERVPIYFLTADGSLESRTRLMQTGAAGVLHKPFHEDDLRRSVASACSSPRITKDREQPTVSVA